MVPQDVAALIKQIHLSHLKSSNHIAHE